MTRASIREYTEAVRGRYLWVSKMEKGKILDEFTKVTGYHRKAAIRLLRRGNQQSAKRKRGRPRQYGIAVAEALRVVWEARDACGNIINHHINLLIYFCTHIRLLTQL